MGLHPVLAARLRGGLNATAPTPVQAASFRPLLEGRDVAVGSETGSGKTLAYLLPLMHDILSERESRSRRRRRFAEAGPGGGEEPPPPPYDYARALILVPNKELVGQVVRMALPLAGGPEALVTPSSAAAAAPTSTGGDLDDGDADGFDTVIRIAVLPGGLDGPDDFRPFREASKPGSSDRPPDLLVSTPAAVGPWGSKPRLVGFFADVPTLVVDEADMCVDGGYVRDVEGVLLGFRRADRLRAGWGSAEGGGRAEPGADTDYHDDDSDRAPRGPGPPSSALAAPRKTQHAFVAATIPDYGLRSVSAWLSRRFPGADRIEVDGLHLARHSGLTRPTEWVLAEEKKDRMRRLVQLLRGELEGDKVMVFCNSVGDADAAAQALRRSGFAGAVPYHAKLAPADRADGLERFRAYRPPAPRDGSGGGGGGGGGDEDGGPVVLVCTDLAARGLDISGVTAVVQLQFAGNAVAHLHRMGRCGRPGSASSSAAGSSASRAGRGVVFYGARESELVGALREAEQRQERSSLRLSGDVSDEGSWRTDGDEDDDGDGEHEGDERGTVRKAFSRKRGFTKKRKKASRSSETS
jgi:superfamily II DNA/RNA helicase